VKNFDKNTSKTGKEKSVFKNQNKTQNESFCALIEIE
jgi:hypothetical protein